MKCNLSIQRPTVKSTCTYSWSFDVSATTVLIPCTAKLLPTELIEVMCVHCHYHWHGPLELMNQMACGVSCWTERVICPYTSMESCDLLVGGKGYASFKGNSVTQFCYLVFADNYWMRPDFPYCFLPQIPWPCSSYLFFFYSPFPVAFQLFVICLLFLPFYLHLPFLSIQKITYLDSLVHIFPYSKPFLHHSIIKTSTFVSLVVSWYE
jgi:hypothetical protein